VTRDEVLSEVRTARREDRRANLRCAVLRDADLYGADLGWADLRGADLRRANLYGANLYGANLADADLRGAVLAGADLRGADLTGADLTVADLTDADMRDADLTDTCLDPDRHCPIYEDDELLADGFGLDVDDGGRETIWGWRTRASTYIGSHEYTPGWHEAPYLSLDEGTECHPGIYLWGLDRLLSWLDDCGRLPHCPVVRCYCYRDEIVRGGAKWRAQRICVVEEDENE